MQPTDDQIKQLMTSVACSVCGATYAQESIEVIGRRDELWFLKVSCGGCATCGLVAALVRPAVDSPAPAQPTPQPASQDLDRPRVARAVTRRDVLRMREFLTDFDGNFEALFQGQEPGVT